MPKVSVIIPIYGVEKYIERCARSLFEQTLDDIEYIFVDDCTKDNSIAVLERVIEDYPNRKLQITILHHDVNKGLPQARKTGVSVAKGEYITHCDSDDWIAEKYAYERMYIKAISEDLDVVICEYFEGDEKLKNHKTIKSQSENEMLINEMLTHNVPVSVWNKITRKELYSNNPIIYSSHNMGEDLVLMVQIAYYSDRVGYIHEPFYFYYKNSTSITNQQSQKSIYARYTDMRCNTLLVCTFLDEVGLSFNYKDELDTLKEDSRYFLLPLIENNYYREEWLSVFPELKYTLTDYFNRGKRKYALRYFLVYTHIYVCMRRIKHFFYK